jgi:hypothetical protein
MRENARRVQMPTVVQGDQCRQQETAEETAEPRQPPP